MAHYKLNDGVYFVQGALRGALLNTNTGNVYSTNPSGVSVVLGTHPNETYWQKLVQMGLVAQTELPEPLPQLPHMDQNTLKFVWFEIMTSDCNESCIHCYADSMPPSFRKRQQLSIMGEAPQTERLGYDVWCQLIKEAYDLGCRAGQFIGGEPLLFNDNGKTTLDLADHALCLGYSMIEIFTNGTLLTRAKVQRIKDLGLHVAVSLYSNDAGTHDAITQVPGSHAKTMAALRMLTESDVHTRVGIIAMKPNENTLKETIRLVEDMGVQHRLDVLRPKGRGDNPNLKPSIEIEVQYGIKVKPNFRVTNDSLAHYTSGHSCLAGKITITETGDVLPCIFTRNHVMGNVLTAGGLAHVLINDATQRVWHTTKDNVLVCRDCEYRYVCFDCRPLSEAVANGQSDYLHAPYPRCSYNPYTGEWGKGLWRMRDNQPYYDESYGSIIQQVVGSDEFTPVGTQSH